MNMQRHYFVSDSLDDLELLEEQLEAAGVSTPQIHVLSRNDAAVGQHRRLHEVQSFMKQDIVHSTELGAGVGLCGFVLVLALAHLSGWAQTEAGWIPFFFLAIVLLGFATWMGGFLGIGKPNHKFARFEQVLHSGKHVFFVDLEPRQEAVLEKLLRVHPQVEPAGTGSAVPYWLIALQQRSGMIRHT